MGKKTALVIGATGLVGSYLVRQLLEDDRILKVKVFARRSLNIDNNKLEEFVIDFEKFDKWNHYVKGDILFSALGTTLKQAGNKQAQYKVDFIYQLNFARIALVNKVQTFVLVSSVGADSNSRIFYAKMKGELDEAIMTLGFSSYHILRPGPLVGKREKERYIEKIVTMPLQLVSKLGVVKKYKPIHAKEVARAMIITSFINESGIYEPADIFSLLS